MRSIKARWFARQQRRNGCWVVHRPPTPKSILTALPGSAIGTDDCPAPTTRLAWVMTPDLYFQWDENGNMQVVGPNGVIPKDSPDYPLRRVDVVRIKDDDKDGPR